jgi:hypothetical protein
MFKNNDHSSLLGRRWKELLDKLRLKMYLSKGTKILT